MGRENTIVVTAYGTGDVIDRIAISMFESEFDWRKSDNARTYCVMTNSIELSDDKWVFAKIIPANTPFSLEELQPVKFHKVILNLEDRSLQKVIREISMDELAKAIKNCSNDILEKIFINLSGRAQQNLKEDMERIGTVHEKEMEDCQEKTLSVIRHLQNTREIIVN
jgi:flagellar motor switch protein FliG